MQSLPMPKFLVDEDMPLSSAEFLRQRGFDAVHVKETGLSGKLDSDIFAFAQIEKRIVMTRDRGFANTLDYPLGAHWGIKGLSLT